MGRDDSKLTAAKRSYQSAKGEGNHQEEARWANVIGDILKNRGEYVKALKWLKIDYEVSVKHLPLKQCLPTCQSLGELYLRLEYFQEALFYQKKHLELARDTDDLVEQQRASTQLGRTYHELFLKSEDDHLSIRNAKKYFKAAMKLAQTLKENRDGNSDCSFLKEYIDAHNNIGMLEMDLDNLEEAKKILSRGLQICDEEEVREDDDGRSRLHHNLGNVYMELRVWDKALEQIEKDILICKRIGHCQGEAKGYINLGELHNRIQKYDDALCCYRKALDLAKSMEDEDALVRQINQNIQAVKEAVNVLGELKEEEQNFKKLTRNLLIARGTPRERKCLLQQNASIDCLIEKSRMIHAWLKLRGYAKTKKRITSELCDKEKLSDSLLAIGESYHKLRKFNKAIKWYMKSWEIYKLIGNQEGQAMVKINIGDVLDSDGNWQGALAAFEESYRIAVQANLHSVQLLALENMHYSHMIRFDNFEEASSKKKQLCRRLQLLTNQLKEQSNREPETQDVAEDHCSETDTEEDTHASHDRTHKCFSPETSKSSSSRSKSLNGLEDLNDDVPLTSLFCSTKRSPKMEAKHIGRQNNSVKAADVSPKCLSKSISDQQTVIGRKRVRVILSDDEDEMHDEVESSRGGTHNNPIKDVANSNEFGNRSNKGCSFCTILGISTVDSKCVNGSCNPVNIGESLNLYKVTSPHASTQSEKCFRSSINDEAAIPSAISASSSKCETNVPKNLLRKHNVANLKVDAPGDEYDASATHSALKPFIMFKIGKELINLDASSFLAVDTSSIEALKVELACLYYLQHPVDKRPVEFPIIQLIKFGERVIDSLEAIVSLKDCTGEVFLEAFIEGGLQKRLIKLYVDCCMELSETPNMKLMKKLYDLEVSDDEVIVPECDLRDLSITPLLNALHAHKTFVMLDFSHNLLGNGTMEKLQQVLTLSGQKFGSLVLDLHCNLFGPTALYQICECPVLYKRLEVLNISGNRLTDACAFYLSTILENCQVLCSLNIERCSITSRTIQKVADALGPESVLEQLCIGYNDHVTGSAIINLLVKLANLKRFSKLNLNGLKLTKRVIDSLSQLVKSSCLSSLMLAETGIGTDGALQVTESFNLTEDPVKLDLSHCGLTPVNILKISTIDSLIFGELNLTGNPIMQASNALSSILLNPRCRLEVLILNKCQLGAIGILQIVQALAGNSSVAELNLADNAQLDKYYPPQQDITKGSSQLLEPNSTPKSSPKMCVLEELGPSQPDICITNTDCCPLEVADSEDDDLVRAEAAASGIDDSCASSSQRKFSSPACQYVQELSTAIGEAKKLCLLDLSNNGLSTEGADMLYTAWSSSRAGSTYRHVKDQTIHFTMEGSKCCIKPCCRKY